MLLLLQLKFNTRFCPEKATIWSQCVIFFPWFCYHNCLCQSPIKYYQWPLPIAILINWHELFGAIHFLHCSVDWLDKPPKYWRGSVSPAISHRLIRYSSNYIFSKIIPFQSHLSGNHHLIWQNQTPVALKEVFCNCLQRRCPYLINSLYGKFH